MSALRDKVAAGDKADVLVMPTNILDDYQKNGVVRRKAAPSSVLSASMRWCEPGSEAGLSTLDKVKQSILNSRTIVHATPGATPSGTHMGKLIEQFGISDAMKGKMIHRPALEGGVQLVASGEAESAFTRRARLSILRG